MTPDSRRLSEAALAAIGERIDEKPPRGLGDYAFQADRDRRALLDHAAYLAERLGEAERENERGIITDDKSIESAFLEYWGERSDDKPNRMAAHRAYCYRAFQEAKTLADLRAQLARERADHAATVAELRTALERYGKHDGQMPDRKPCLLLSDELGRPQSYRCTCGLDTALAATPSDGAAAVAAATEGGG